MNKEKKGQILILVLLVVVVSLSIGLSVASRNIINVRTSTQTEHSQRAFSAAEGGVEDVLSRLTTDVIPLLPQPVNTTQNGCQVKDDPDDVNNYVECSVAVGTMPNPALVRVKGTNEFQRVIDVGDVGQIDLTASSGQVKIEWSKNGDSFEDPPASIEITQIHGLFPAYSQSRWFFEGLSGRAGESIDASNNPPGNISCVSSEYRKCWQMNIQANPQILRIRPYWQKATIKVSGVAAPLAVQFYDIASSANTEIGVSRKVQVTRSAKPQLPAVFDYVLYSEGDIIK